MRDAACCSAAIRGAGKSTLAYACARAGWSLTSDDASYLHWGEGPLRLRGNPHQVRFRPSAREIFPELQGRSLTPRTAGKPSIEVPTAELPNIAIAPESAVRAILRLHRHEGDEVTLTPLPPSDLQPYFEAPLFPLAEIFPLQVAPLHLLLRLPLYEFRYRDLPSAIACLEALIATFATMTNR